MLEPTEQVAKVIPPEVMKGLEESLGSLEQSLLARDGKIPNHLAEIHRYLISFPETNVLLEDDEIETLIKAQQEHTRVVIIAETTKGKGGGKKSKITADDL